MTRYTWVVYTNAVEGKDDEFNDWYSNRHIADVLAVDGFVAAQRFRLAETDPPQDGDGGYLALYEIETDDLTATGEALSKAIREGMFISPTFDQLAPRPRSKYFSPITERMTAKDAE